MTTQSQKWYQNKGYITLAVLLSLSLIGAIVNITEDKPEESAKVQIENKMDNISFDSLNNSDQVKIVERNFSGFKPPNGINLEKLLLSQFKFPDETDLSYQNYKFFNSKNIVAGYDYKTKNAFGVKSSGSIRVWYRSDQNPNDSFTAYKYEIVSNSGEISNGEIIYNK